MKHLGLVHILLLLLGTGLFLGPATAELTASQEVPPTANVGENVMVTVMLTYSGSNATQASITPGLPSGLETNFPGGQTELYPGVTAPISYPIRAVQSGTYLVTSQVSYSEEGTGETCAWNHLSRPLASFSQGQLQTYPGQEMPGVWPQSSNPFGTNPYGTYPYGTNPTGTLQNGTIQNGTLQNGLNPGINPGAMPPSGGVMPEGMPNEYPSPIGIQPEQSQPGPTGYEDQASGPNGSRWLLVLTHLFCLLLSTIFKSSRVNNACSTNPRIFDSFSPTFLAIQDGQGLHRLVTCGRDAIYGSEKRGSRGYHIFHHGNLGPRFQGGPLHIVHGAMLLGLLSHNQG